MRTLKTLGLALVLAVTALAVPAEAKEARLIDELGFVDVVGNTVNPLETAIPALETHAQVLDIDVKAKTFRSTDKPDTSPEVLGVADGRGWRIHAPTVSPYSFQAKVNTDLFEPNSGGRNVIGLHYGSIDLTTHYMSACEPTGSVPVATTNSGSCRVDCPISTGVAPV